MEHRDGQMRRGAETEQSHTIARRYARFGEHKGLALWLELTAPWHEAGKSS